MGRKLDIGKEIMYVVGKLGGREGSKVGEEKNVG